MYEDCMILSMRFPQKLWRIVNECKTGAIRWNPTGSTILLDYKRFQEEYLAASKPIFKTNNMTSFIRQLNLYGFRKVTSHNRDPVCNSQNPDVHEFAHENFRAGRSDLLNKVCRKAGAKNKYPQRKDSKDQAKDSSPRKENQMSRLQMCQLALTETLEQVVQEYRQKRELCNEGNAFNAGMECSGCNFYAVPGHEIDMEWIAKNAIPLASKETNMSRCNSWYIIKMCKDSSCSPYSYYPNIN